MFRDTKAFSGFAVDDPEAARRFYAETLGLQVTDAGGDGMLTLELAGDRPTLIYPKPDHTPASFTVLNFPVDDIEAACIQPPAGIVERFASYFPPDTPLSFILMRIKAAATVGTRYRLNIGNDILEIADIIQDLPLTIYDRLTFCYLPVALRAEGAVDVLRALARVVAENSNGDLLSIKEIPLEFLDIDLADYQGGAQEYLYKLESLHVAINQYVWLSYRYAGMFRSQALAFHVRSLVEEKLIGTLDRLDFTEEQLESKRKTKRRQAQSRKLSMEQMGEGEGVAAGLEQERDDPPVTDWPLDKKDAQPQVVERGG